MDLHSHGNLKSLTNVNVTGAVSGITSTNIIIPVGFEVLTVVDTNSTIFWDITLCS
jgi:hypothetical protein